MDITLGQCSRTQNLSRLTLETVSEQRVDAMKTQSQFETAIEELVNPSQILVATDLSDCEFLLPHAIEQAKVYGAQLTFVHALLNVGIPGYDIAAGYVDLEPWADERMKRVVETVRAEGVSCESRITRTLFPEDSIPAALRGAGAKRLIMSTHGRGRIGQMMLGSVAQKLLNALDIPLFVVGPHVGTSPEHCNPRRILHAVSFAKGYEETVEFACRIAERHGAELMLSHVLDPDIEKGVNSRRTLQWAKTALEEAAGDRTAMGIPLLTRVDCGNVIDEILNAARVFRADWIVLGARLRTEAPVLANSIAYKLTAAANVPVLTFPHNVSPKGEEAARPKVAVAAR